MPEINGRLKDRKQGTLELTDDKLVLKVKNGFFGGKTDVTETKLEDIASTETRTGEKPYREALKLAVTLRNGEALEFYSSNKAPLQEISDKIVIYVDARLAQLEQDRQEFTSSWEVNMALLYLNFELVDALLKIVLLLNGHIDWHSIEKLGAQVDRIVVDRANVPVLKPAKIGTGRLREAVIQRLPDIIKTEVYDTVFLVYQGCLEAQHNSDPWFPTGLHAGFIRALLSLYNNEFALSLGLEPAEAVDEAQRFFDEFYHLVKGKVEVDPIDGVASFRQNRLILVEWMEQLLKVEFKE